MFSHFPALPHPPHAGSLLNIFCPQRQIVIEGRVLVLARVATVAVATAAVATQVCDRVSHRGKKAQ
jgi:hypothetical protein